MQSVCPLAPLPLLPTQRPSAVTAFPTRTPIASTSEQPSTTPNAIPSVVPTPSCPPIRTNIGNDTSAIGREPISNASMPQQKKHILHNFYDPLQYDPRGRGVGTNSPVLSPSECPEISTITPNAKDDSPVTERNTKPMLNKKVKSKEEKKEKLLQPKKGGANSNKNANVDQHGSDDDLSFVEIEKTDTSPSEAPGTLDKSNGKSSFGSITPSNAPTTLETHTSKVPVTLRTSNSDSSFGSITASNAPTPTSERLEIQFKTNRDGSSSSKHIPNMMEKNKKRTRLTLRR